MEEFVSGIKISHPDRVVYKNDGVTKLEVAWYYDKVKERMFPYLKNRLLSVIRAHNDISEVFFKKHPNAKSKFVKSVVIDNEDEPYFYLPNTDSVVYQAQLGTIEFHIWASSLPKIEQPDIMTFDLDPDQNLSLDKLREGVSQLKKLLDQLGLKAFLKTSGGKGYHILVPFSSSSGYQDFSAFARGVAELLERQNPKLFTTNIRKNERKGKIFVDFLRNKKGATCVCPYSLRARAGASVSFPLSWSELDKVAPNEINMAKAIKKIKNKDPWQDFFKVKQSLSTFAQSEKG